MNEFFTRHELAERWKCTIGTIDARMRDGIIKPCKNLPGVKFKLADVLAAEETKFNPLSPMEKRRLERENGVLVTENQRLRKILLEITIRANQFAVEETEVALDGNRC